MTRGEHDGKGGRWCAGCGHSHGSMYVCEHYDEALRAEAQAELQAFLVEDEREFQERRRHDEVARPILEQIWQLTANHIPPNGLRMSPPTFRRFVSAMDARMFVGGGATPDHALLAIALGPVIVFASEGMADDLVEVVQ